MQFLFLPELWELILILGTIIGLFMQSSHSHVSYLFNVIYRMQKEKLLKSNIIKEEKKFILLFNEIGIKNDGLFSNALLILTDYNIYIYKNSLFGKVTLFQYKYDEIKSFKFKEGWLGNDIELHTTGNKIISLTFHEVGNYDGAVNLLDKIINKKNIVVLEKDNQESAVLIRFIRAIVSFSRITILLPFRWFGFHIKNPIILSSIGAFIGFVITIMPNELRPELWEFVKTYTPIAIIFWILSW